MLSACTGVVREVEQQRSRNWNTFVAGNKHEVVLLIREENVDLNEPLEEHGRLIVIVDLRVLKSEI